MRAVTLLLVLALASAARAQDAAPTTAVAAPADEGEEPNGCLLNILIIMQGFMLGAVSLYYFFTIIMSLYLQCLVMAFASQYLAMLNLQFITQMVTTGLLAVAFMLPTALVASVGTTVQDVTRPLVNLLDPILGPVLNPVLQPLGRVVNSILSPLRDPLSTLLGSNGLTGIVLQPVGQLVGSVLGTTTNVVNALPIVGTVTSPLTQVVSGAGLGVAGTLGSGVTGIVGGLFG